MLRALIWPLFAQSAWTQPATVKAGTTSESAVLASVRSFGMVKSGTKSEGFAMDSFRSIGVGSASRFGCRHDR